MLLVLNSLPLGLRPHLPVLDPKTRDPAELGGIVGHQREPRCHGDRGNQQIVRSYKCAAYSKIGPDPSVRLCRSIIERQRDVRAEESL